jgi:uncharacterized protein YneF (UPF0154 family)
MFKAIVNFFDRLEDKVRASLSHRSVIYAFIGGSTHVLFWRGIWITSDIIRDYGWRGIWTQSNVSGFWGWVFYEPVTLIWATIVLLITGLFVAGFIGERIIISGLKKEKKITDRTVREVESEDNKIRSLESKMDLLLKEIIEIKNVVSKK